MVSYPLEKYFCILLYHQLMYLIRNGKIFIIFFLKKGLNAIGH